MALGYSAVVLLAIRSTPVGVLRLLDRFAASALAESMMPIVRMVGAVLAWLFMPTPLGFLLAWGTSELVVSGTYWLLAYRHGRGAVARVRPVMPHISRRRFPGMIRFLFATNINLSLLTLINSVPVLILGMFVGAAEAGYYRLAAQLANAMTTFSQLLSRAIFAEMTRSYARADDRGRHAEMRYLMRRTSGFALVGGSIVVLTLWLVGKPILLAMSGVAYLPAYSLLLLLGTAAAIEMAGVSFDPLLLTTDRPRISVMVRIVEAILLCILLYLLLPHFGATGAALAVLAAALTGLLLRGAAVWVHLR